MGEEKQRGVLRLAAHGRGKQLEEIQKFLEGVFSSPDTLERLLSNSLNEREREDMAAIMGRNSSADLSRLVLRGFTLSILEKRLEKIVRENKLSQDEATALKELLVQSVRPSGSFSDKFFFVTSPALFMSSVGGAMGLATFFSSAPRSDSFLVFAGASLITGALVSGFYHAAKTLCVLDGLDTPLRRKIRTAPLVGRSFINGVLPGALAGIFAGAVLTAVTEPEGPPPPPRTEMRVSASAAKADPSPPETTARRGATVLIVPKEFAEAARRAAELCGMQSQVTSQKITCEEVGAAFPAPQK